MFTHYIKSYFLSLKKNRFFYSINLFGFSIGFLILTIIFSFVYQELSFDRFHKNADNIYRIHAAGYGVTPLCFADKLNNKIPEIKDVIRFSSGNLKIKNDNEILNFGKVYFTDPAIFQQFSFKILSGDAPNVLIEPYSIVISKSKAKELFHDEFPVGQIIKDKKDIIYTITGVMEDIPYNSHIQADAFVSIETLRETGNDKTFNCGSWSILTYVCLTENSKPEEAETKINSVLEEFRMGSGDSKIPLKLEPLRKIYFDAENNKYDGSKHGNFQTVLLYLAISILILFIVVVNYINLSTAISTGRIKEIAIRKINGAKQSYIIKQTVIESIGTAIISFLFAVLLIELLLPQLCLLLNIGVSESFNRLSLYLLYFAGAIFIGTITGLFPGVFLSKVREIKALKGETVFNSRGLQRKILLAFQMLIVATLLNSTFIIKSQIDYIFKRDLGLSYENIVSFKLTEELRNKRNVIKDKLLKNPDIKRVSFSDNLIGDGFAKAPKGNNDNQQLCYFFSVDPDYFKLYNIKISKGRNFSWDLKTDFNESCILNEEACRVFGFENPLNKSLGDHKIIGVVQDFNFTSLHNQIEPLIIYCEEGGNTVQVKLSDKNQNSTIQYIDNVSEKEFPNYDFNYVIMKDRIKKMYKSELNLKSSFQFYSLITFIIALLGLFGLTLFLIKKKTKEVSVRKLFGARLKDTFILLINKQIVIVLIANIISVPVSYFFMQNWLSNFQYKVDIGCFVFLKTLTITVLLTISAMVVMILRVHKVNPIETLRME